MEKERESKIERERIRENERVCERGTGKNLMG